MKRFVLLGSLLLAMLLALAACGIDAVAEPPDEPVEGAAEGIVVEEANLGPITVASKNFTEQFILGEMYAQLLEANGFQVDRELGLGATDVVHAAMLEGEVDLYPEYTSTGLLTVLQEQPETMDREAIYEQVKEGYEEQFDITWLEPAPFNNTQALAVTEETAEEYDLTRISQLTELAPQLRIGGPPEFFVREDGLPGLEETYGEMDFAEERQLDAGSLRYEALLDDQIDVVVAYGTDGQIGGYDLLVLEDDQGLWPPYQVAPVILESTLQQYPQIADILNNLSPILDNRTMANLNWRVDGPENMEPDEVAREFLQEQGFIESPS
ncbi:MAG: quaternary ammonium transporter [Chloroflexota bacterium]|nr:quaternary ammonium transporter [Chloroflexota bacterium]